MNGPAIFGIAVTLGLLIWAILLGGDPSLFVDPASLLTVCGVTVGNNQ